MRIKMLTTHNFIIPGHKRRDRVRYLAGHGYTVKRAWGQAMVEAGHARPDEAPPRRPEPSAPAARPAKAAPRRRRKTAE